ncbi:hypothetical protein ACFFX0_32030 [Citricoccus parietis]|uniref:Uncharacterized protein n=1 Tax=Citricoccus parietis TaxID=592307 RepID=A0ABV5GAA6_9MICC
MATAASAALPPWARMSIPASTASGWAAATACCWSCCPGSGSIVGLVAADDGAAGAREAEAPEPAPSASPGRFGTGEGALHDVSSSAATRAEAVRKAMLVMRSFTTAGTGNITFESRMILVHVRSQISSPRRRRHRRRGRTDTQPTSSLNGLRPTREHVLHKRTLLVQHPCGPRPGRPSPRVPPNRYV